MSAENSEVVRAALVALGREDSQGFVALLHPEVSIETGRGVRQGHDAAIKWATKRFDYLVRCWRVDEILEDENRLLVLGDVQYVWRESGDVGDSTPTALGFELQGGQIEVMRVYETVDEGLEDFGMAAAEAGAR